MMTRRLLVVFGIGTFVAINIAALVLLRRSEPVALENANTPLEKFLQSEYVVPMTDVSGFESDFATKVSFAPLCSLSSNVREATYVCRTKTSMYGTDGVLLQTAPVKPIEANVERKRQFLREGNDQVTVVEEVIIDDPNPIAQMIARMQASKRVLAADGRYVEKASNSLRKYFRELDPVFPSENVATGTTWEQRISVDSRLNPGGECIRKFRVPCVYEKDGEKYVRVSSFFRFRGYRPQSDGEADALNEESDDVLTYCSQEVVDIQLSSGLVVEKGVLTRVYQESINTKEGAASGYPGLVTETSVSEKLIDLLGVQDGGQKQARRSSPSTKLPCQSWSFVKQDLWLDALSSLC